MAGDRNRDAFTEANLSRLAAFVIQAFRDGAHETLLRMAALAGLSAQTPGSAFSILIRTFHPDRLRHYRELIEAGESAALPDLSGALAAMAGGETAGERRARNRADAEAAFRGAPAEGFTAETEPEESGYDADDFDEIREREWPDADGPDAGEDMSDADAWDEYDGRRSFADAVRLKEYGSLDVQYTPGILRSIEGMLDLSDFEIDTLEGAQYCENVEVLNISGNRITDLAVLSRMTALTELYAAGNVIDSLEGLAGLSRLRVLDVAGNQIEDISVLHSLDLEVLNVAGNPVPDSQKQDLREKGVIVID